MPFPTAVMSASRQKCTQGECQRDEDCTEQEACEDYYCINPCKDLTCQKEYFCKVIRHVPVCGKQYVPVPVERKEIFVIGQSYKPEIDTPVISTRSQAAPSNTFVIGSRHGGGGYGGGSSGRSPSKPATPRSYAAVIGSRYRKRRHLVPFLFQF